MELQRIGRYRILRELGRGAMGVVYLADDPTLKRQVAIKTISLGAGLPPQEREEARRRFLREAQAAAGLIHPNIVLVLDVGAEKGDLFIAMEYIQGPSLEAFTRPPDLLPTEKVVGYMAEACDALDLAHRHQIVHRDLKPANLMAAEGERLKITDFGLAKNPNTSLTHTGTLVGTPSYMSPEQIQGAALDGRSDLFSLGVVLYELLTGEKPFPGDTISTVIYRVLHEEPTLPSRVNPRLAPVFDSIVARVLQKDPRARFQTAAEFAGALRDPAAFAALHPPAATTRVTAAPPPAAARAVPRARPAAPAEPPPRKRGGVMKGLVLSFVALALIGFALGTFVPSARRLVRRQAIPRLLAILPTSLGGGAPLLQLASDGPDVRYQVGGRAIESDLLPWEASLAGAVVEATDGCRRGERPLPARAPRGRFHVPLTDRLRHRLTVASDPSGAAVAVDGRRVGDVTPASVELDACRSHEITFHADGFAVGRLRLPVGADWASLALPSVGLEALPAGSVRWETPYPLAIFEGDQRLGSTGEAISLTPGRHDLSLRSAEHRVRIDQELRVEPAAQQVLRPQVPPLGSVRVNVYPGNARIVVDGTEAGPPPLNLRLGAGTHEIGVRWSAGAPATAARIVTVRGGDNPPVNFKQGT